MFNIVLYVNRKLVLLAYYASYPGRVIAIVCANGMKFTPLFGFHQRGKVHGKAMAC